MQMLSAHEAAVFCDGRKKSCSSSAWSPAGVCHDQSPCAAGERACLGRRDTTRGDEARN